MNTKPLLVFLLLVAPIAHATSLEVNCEAKLAVVKRQLLEARKQDNAARIKGLEKALANIEHYCTDERLVQQRQADIEAKAAKLEERQAELDEALRKGDAEKIAKRQAKLEKAQRELENAKAGLPH